MSTELTLNLGKKRKERGKILTSLGKWEKVCMVKTTKKKKKKKHFRGKGKEC